MENQELKLIKKIYGEEMMHLCRDLFPTLLETPYQVYNILEKNIAPTKSLATDIIENVLEEEFKNYIYSFIDVEQKQIETDKTPSELLKEKGYILYECNTEEEIQKFKKYYSKAEELCTFRNNRLERCYVFFAVKENVEEIKREDFKNPDRQDLYGTSVISIQFSKDENNTLSIKNRYNHTVNNPDATYSNNLENIIPGLTDSFEKYYGLNITQETNISSEFLTDELNYVRCNDKYYRYNYELNYIYYCENNIIIDNGRLIDKYNKEKERYILIDYFIIDKKEKTLFLYDKKTIEDSFIDSVNGIGTIKDIISSKDKSIIIQYEDGKEVNIRIDQNNIIISYENDYVKIIEDGFLYCNHSLMSIKLPKVEIIGDGFLFNNEELKKIELPKVKIIGLHFLFYNKFLEKIGLPRVEIIGANFLYNNEKIEKMELPKAMHIDNDFLGHSISLEKIELPKAKKIGDRFLQWNKRLKEIELPKVEIIGDGFLYNNEKLEKIELPKVKIIEDNFLYYNLFLEKLELPEAETIGNCFLCNNSILEKIELPNVKNIGKCFLCNNLYLEKIELLRVEIIGDKFLCRNKVLTKIELPNVKQVGYCFLDNNLNCQNEKEQLELKVKERYYK